MTVAGPEAARRSPWDPDRDQWAEILDDQPRYRVDQVWTGLYDQATAPGELTVLPKKLRARLDEGFAPALELVTAQQSGDGETIKWLWRGTDDPAARNRPADIETVLMGYDKRVTVCVSSQSGCAMGCGFCATGQAGYERHLSVGEILEQVVAAKRAAGDRHLSNVVFMGMGEPFANYERVLESVRRLVVDFDLAARHVTVSTVGLVPQIRRFAAEGLQVGLAISVHAANDELRDELVPINRRHPLGELVDASQEFRSRTGRRVSFEWAMIDGVNDRTSDAHELANLARAAQAHVNLIPLNPTPGYPATGTPQARIRDFAGVLESGGVNVTVRRNRGTDIDAACGQLRLSQRASGRTGSGQPVELRSRP